MSVAKSYAKALLESAVEAGMTSVQCAQIENQIRGLVEVVSSSRSLEMVLFGPATTTKEKISVLEDLGRKLSLEPLLVRFLDLMARKRRLDLVGLVSRAYRELRLEREGMILGELVSADPLSPSDIEELSVAFGARIGRKVSFETHEDPSLLAGVKVTVGGVTYDGTMRSQLSRLRETLSRAPVAQVSTQH